MYRNLKPISLTVKETAIKINIMKNKIILATAIDMKTVRLLFPNDTIKKTEIV